MFMMHIITKAISEMSYKDLKTAVASYNLSN